MNSILSDNKQVPRGYLSEEHKRKFTITAGILGAIFFIQWVVGIRVIGTDLRPCGFGRALVRNLLKFIDGFFNFMVGILLTALSENCQRLGDMAANTIVVDARKGMTLDLD